MTVATMEIAAPITLAYFDDASSGLVVRSSLSVYTVSFSTAFSAYSIIDDRYTRQRLFNFSSEVKTCFSDSRALRVTDLSLSYKPASHEPTICGMYFAIRLPQDTAIWPWRR